VNEEEIIRRVRALIATAPADRPMSVDRVEQLAGLANGVLYEIGKRGTMSAASRSRLARALVWVENDQVQVKRRANKPSLIRILDPKPPQEILSSVQMSAGGPRIRFLAVNPRAFPHRAPNLTNRTKKG